MPGGKGRMLGIDYGSKRVGVAVSDPFLIISQGVGTLENNDQIFQQLLRIVKEQGIVRIIVGMPYSSDGGKGAKAVEVEEFISRLRQVIEVEIETWDESYSSVNAQQAFIDGGMGRKKRQQKSRVDEMAARLLLQEYLDTLER